MVNHGDRQMIGDENSVLCLAALSDIGDREDQQDSFGYSLRQDGGLTVVCDGMGGHEGGKLASALAVETFLSGYNGSPPADDPTAMLIETAKRADAAISQLKNGDGRLLKAGTTLVSVAVCGRKLMWCSVGDSRAYLLRDGELVQLTQDQNYRTVLEEKMRAGLLDEDGFRRENERGDALISFLGIGNLTLIDYSAAPLALMKDDKIIIMSDGLYRLVSDAEISRILDNFSNIGEALQALEMKAKKNAKNLGAERDNVTMALIKIK